MPTLSFPQLQHSTTSTSTLSPFFAVIIAFAVHCICEANLVAPLHWHFPFSFFLVFLFSLVSAFPITIKCKMSVRNFEAYMCIELCNSYLLILGNIRSPLPWSSIPTTSQSNSIINTRARPKTSSLLDNERLNVEAVDGSLGSKPLSLSMH